MYGLVRQVGPWDVKESDILNIYRPREYDPSDRQLLKPDAVPNGVEPFQQYSQIGGGVTLTRLGVLDRAMDDPRVQTPGRRLSVNRLLGSKRVPMEMPEGSSIKALRAAGMNMGQGDQDPTKGTPYTLLDTSKAPDLSKEQQQQLIIDQEKIKATQQTGFGPFYDPSKTIEVWNKMTDAEKKLAKEQLAIWRTMTVEQQVREWSKESSIIRRIYTLYKGDMPAKYLSEVIEVMLYFLPLI